MISTLTPNQLVASQVSILSAFLPAFYFSDFVFEIDSMPVALQWVSYIVPARYFVSSLQTVFLAGDIWPVILPDTAALGLVSVVIFTVTLMRTRTRQD